MKWPAGRRSLQPGSKEPSRLVRGRRVNGADKEPGKRCEPVRAPWRRQHLAQAMHDLPLKDRHEERATLTVLPTTAPAQAAYQKWGWQKVAEKRNPLPGSPLFDVLVKPLADPGAGR